VGGVTDVVDQLLGTDTTSTDDGLNLVTTDVQQLLTGEDDLISSVNDLLGGHAADDTAGSVDQLVDGVTDAVDQLLGTDTEQVDDLLNEVTTLVSDLLGGNISLDADAGASTSGDGGLLSLNLLSINDNDFNNG
ncbi:hypothetical protein, partial [Thiomicrorhabdus sp. 6S3-12]|uniref:hypothetical protein n=1 Tax=Thiomicrorhabdus sp. 6S3-12 TaxID=2819681 RepID=UPI001AAD2D95